MTAPPPAASTAATALALAPAEPAATEPVPAEPTELQRRLRLVKPPPAVLHRERERRLTDRQREVLERLGPMFDEGFAGLTMAEIASRARCSLRTLYGLAPSRDELVLVVVDRSLWRVGRAAMGAIAPSMSPLEALQAYLGAASKVADGTAAFARDLADMPAAQRLGDFHADYVEAVTRCLLGLAVEAGEIRPVDTGAVAHVMTVLARELSRPEVIPTLSSSPRHAADSLVAIMVRGMRANGEDRHE